MPFLHLRNGELHTVYNLLVLGLPQTPRAHQEPPDHQDRLGAVKHQEKQAPKPSLDLHSVGPSSSTLATLAKDGFFKVEAQTKC